jgi:hypothetical protein
MIPRFWDYDCLVPKGGKMKKSIPILLSVTVLLILSLACVLPSIPAPTQDIHSLETAVMGTMVSGATQTAIAGIPVGLVDTATPLPTFTSELPTLSPTVTFTAAPIFTSTPVVPLISVSVATNCRVGPGKVYDRVGALSVGQVAEVIGRNDAGNYWYIRNPSQSNGFCWLWGEYATLTGSFASLPVFTPPPTPTPMPDFEAYYDGLESCSGWWPDIEVVNTGGITFESIAIMVRDTDTNLDASLSSDLFHDIDGCSDTFTRERLNPGDSRVISGPIFTYDPRGHQLRATITLCSRDGLNGTCITENVRFTP